MTTDERIERLADWLLACQRAGSLDRLVLVKTLSEFVDEATANEQHDIGTLSRHLARVYEHFAGLSKPMTDPEEVIRIAEERQQKDWDENVEERREGLVTEAAVIREAYASGMERMEWTNKVLEFILEIEEGRLG